jgi:hypothetical protein
MMIRIGLATPVIVGLALFTTACGASEVRAVELRYNGEPCCVYDQQGTVITPVTERCTAAGRVNVRPANLPRRC